MKNFPIFVGIAAFLYALLIFSVYKNSLKDGQLCTAAGGVMVQTVKGYQCMSGVVVIHNLTRGNT